MRTKNHLIIGTMIGGILLAATILPVRAIAAYEISPNTNTPVTSQSADNGSGSNKGQKGSGSGSTSGQGSGQNTGQSGSGSNNQPSNSNNKSGSGGGSPSNGQNSPSGSGTSGSNSNGGSGSSGQQSSPSGSGTTTPSNSPSTSGGSTTDPASDGTNSGSNTTPSNSNNSGSGNNQSSDPNTTNTDNNTGQNVDNTTDSDAQSGKVAAVGNDSVGNVASGNASDTTTQVNSLQSTSSLTNKGGLQLFSMDIDGNHTGNIVLDPTDLMPASSGTVAQDPATANINNETNATINNTVGLTATSGNVGVEGNDSAGNVSSGDAATEANIINMINSVVTDQQAFLGVININGNLDGNLLLPPSFINTVLANTNGKNTNTTTNNNTTTTNDNNMNVNNNVTLNAQTGKVSVEGNDSTGNVSSGNASTSLKLYNLTNSDIVGGNVLLVFVNVMGSWVGLLMNALAGTTSTALGGGIQQDVANPINSSNTNNNINETINNNITLNSASGNVDAAGNKNVGNVGSGNASANADIVNIMGSQIDLSGWLGVLIINVYGSWNGSLELEPAAVTVTVHAPAQPHTIKHHSVKHHNYISAASAILGDGFGTPLTSPFTAPVTHILGDSTVKHHDPTLAATNVATKHNSNVLVDFLIGGAAILVGAAAISARAVSGRRKKV